MELPQRTGYPSARSEFPAHRLVFASAPQHVPVPSAATVEIRFQPTPLSMLINSSLSTALNNTPFSPSLKGAPHDRIRREGLHPAPGHVNESAMVTDRAMPEQSCQERQ